MFFVNVAATGSKAPTLLNGYWLLATSPTHGDAGASAVATSPSRSAPAVARATERERIRAMRASVRTALLEYRWRREMGRSKDPLAARLALRVLGPAEVLCDGRPVVLPGRR